MKRKRAKRKIEENKLRDIKEQKKEKGMEGKSGQRKEEEMKGSNEGRNESRQEIYEVWNSEITRCRK